MRRIVVRGRLGRVLFRGGVDYVVRDGVLVVVASPMQELVPLDKLKTFNRGSWRTVEFEETLDAD